MLKVTSNEIALKTFYLFAFLSPCMDGMVSFYNVIESHINNASFVDFLLTFWPFVMKWH